MNFEHGTTLALLTVAGLAAACSGSEQKLPGTYAAETSVGQHRLTLNADGGYEQKFIPAEGGGPIASASNQNCWRLADSQVVMLRRPMTIVEEGAAAFVAPGEVDFQVSQCGAGLCLESAGSQGAITDKRVL